MGDGRHSFGRQAEDLACRFLEIRGYRILERNFRTRFAELDVIAQDKEVLVFLEVKARRSLRRGSPGDAVTPLKQRRMVMAASWYLASRGRTGDRIRFDVVTIVETKGQSAIALIQNAFDAL
jgi:putative endonuclease